MTEYFEVHERVGAARLGELRLAESRTTPALVDDLVADAGSARRRRSDPPGTVVTPRTRLSESLDK